VKFVASHIHVIYIILIILDCVKVNGKDYPLISYDIPKANYIQLETFVKDKNFSRVITFLLPDAKKSSFKLGRGHDADVKIPDISVSRVHAEISLTENGFIVKDHDAKFGTLTLIPSGPFEIDPINGNSLQINRTSLCLSIKPNTMPLTSPCNHVEENQLMYFIRINMKY